MKTIKSARSILDQQDKLAIWYTEYDGGEEEICYANQVFSEIFALPLEEILEKQQYQLEHPTATPVEVIEQYKQEDRVAMEQGSFFSQGPFDAGKEIVVVKLRFDRGMLGIFQIVDEGQGEGMQKLEDLDEEFREVVRALRPDLIA